jgi:hypothetical protein
LRYVASGIGICFQRSLICSRGKSSTKPHDESQRKKNTS